MTPTLSPTLSLTDLAYCPHFLLSSCLLSSHLLFCIAYYPASPAVRLRLLSCASPTVLSHPATPIMDKKRRGSSPPPNPTARPPRASSPPTPRSPAEPIDRLPWASSPPARYSRTNRPLSTSSPPADHSPTAHHLSNNELPGQDPSLDEELWAKVQGRNYWEIPVN